MASPVPIRTGIDNALVASIATVADFTHSGSSVPSVFLNPSRTIQESELKPYVLVLTDMERVKKGNIYREADFMAEISVWSDADDNDLLYPKMIDYGAKIVQALIPNESLVRAAPGLIEIEENPGFSSDVYFYETGKGVILLQFNLKYRTVYGNPYLANPT
jgi:hypothetical protein